MIDVVEAFDILCEKIESRESFDASLVVQASDLSFRGFLAVEKWVISKGYRAILVNRVVRYLPKKNVGTRHAEIKKSRLDEYLP